MTGAVRTLRILAQLEYIYGKLAWPGRMGPFELGRRK